MADLDFMGTGESFLTLSIMVGTARLCLKHLLRARVRATERSNVLFNLCTDLRGPQRLPRTTIWNHVGVSKSAVGLVGRALFQPSLLFHNGEPHDSHTAHRR